MGGVKRHAGARRRHDSGSDRSARALLSFLESHGFAGAAQACPADADEIARRVADGPLPPEYILTLCERAAPAFISLFEAASSLGDGASRLGAEADHAADAPAGRSGVPGGMSIEQAFRRIFDALGEERIGQLDMARAADRALREDGLALIEAGTGTGKSLGYLVPAALFSRETCGRVIVSTYTKNLQEQLYRREMPLLEGILGLGVRAERLLGRDNYLCTRSVIAAAASLADVHAGTGLAFAANLALEGDGTLEGSGPLPARMRPEEIAAPARCPMNACAFAARCPLMRARRLSRAAGILFVNHALLLTDYRQGGGVIGPYAHVIFDEAHHIERCVVENLSVRVAREDCRRMLEPVRLALKDDDAWRLLAHVLSSAGDERAGSMRAAVAEAVDDTDVSFASLFRAIEKSLNPSGIQEGTRVRYTDGGETFATTRESFNRIIYDINRFSQLLKPIQEVALPKDFEAFRQEIGCAAEELGTLSESLRYLSAGSDEESVFWLEWGAGGALRELCGSPLEIDRPFADYLESFMGAAVLTSATLSQNGSFSFVRERLGVGLLRLKPTETIIPSPFPFDDECLVLIVTGLGDPNDGAFAAPVSELIDSLTVKLSRRTLVLFTSYRLCHSVARSLDAIGHQTKVLVQGTGESRESLSERFRRDPGALLLGVASFWEGVDFPGEELEVLVIPKVPFPVPSEPIVEARSERFSALGEDPFEKLFLPEAILRLRQGAGRLIRRMDDRGVIVLLDERLETRPYGPAVLASLPSRRIAHVTAGDCAAAAARWFERA